jgi:xylulokinase
MRIKASVYSHPLRVVSIDEATALGAAMLAGLGAGIYPDVDTAEQSIRYTVSLVEPEPTAVTFYARAYEQVYRQLYPSVRNIHHAIGNLLEN